MSQGLLAPQEYVSEGRVVSPPVVKTNVTVTISMEVEVISPPSPPRATIRMRNTGVGVVVQSLPRLDVNASSNSVDPGIVEVPAILMPPVASWARLWVSVPLEEMSLILATPWSMTTRDSWFGVKASITGEAIRANPSAGPSRSVSALVPPSRGCPAITCSSSRSR